MRISKFISLIGDFLSHDLINHYQLVLNSEQDDVHKVDRLLTELHQSKILSDDLHGTLAIAVTEIVNNAIIHGNKFNINKKVFFDIYHYLDHLVIRIQDQGDGFDIDALPDPLKNENIMKANGRGVYIVRQFVDQVTYAKNDIGMLVELTFWLSQNEN